MRTTFLQCPRETIEQLVFATALGAAVMLSTSEAWCFSAIRPWHGTATGSPTTVTWGFADDGAWIPANGNSNLVSFLDEIWRVSATGLDFAQRPWFPVFSDSFARWGQLSGLTFLYESADDGASLQTSPGVRSVRADIRIGGKNIDGAGSALASTWLPDTGDIVIDSGDSVFWTNAVTANLRARNLLMHEIGHSLGLMHIVSSSSNLLMEPYNSKAFDGPQLDDIRGIQSLYGDKYERTGNNIIGRASNLGSLALQRNLSVGSNAAGDQGVLPGEVDFVSITNSADVDFFSFSISEPGYLSVGLTPWGGTLSQGTSTGPESMIDASRVNDLSVAVLGAGGAPRLALASEARVGSVEVVTNVLLPAAGTYYIRVDGASDEVQLYELDLALVSAAGPAPGDFNADGAVNGRDFMVWQQSHGDAGSNLAADGNRDGVVNATDLGLWQSSVRTRLTAGIQNVPEPTGLAMIGLSIVLLGRRCQKVLK